MNNVRTCQSCAMPMTKPGDFGTEKDGEQNIDYCCYCYKDGSFGKDETMEEMIEICIPFVLEAGEYKSPEEARSAMRTFFPTLKRWTKA